MVLQACRSVLHTCCCRRAGRWYIHAVAGVQVGGVTHFHAVADVQVSGVTFMLLQACRSVVLHSRWCRHAGRWCYTQRCCRRAGQWYTHSRYCRRAGRWCYIHAVAGVQVGVTHIHTCRRAGRWCYTHSCCCRRAGRWCYTHSHCCRRAGPWCYTHAVAGVQVGGVTFTLLQVCRLVLHTFTLLQACRSVVLHTFTLAGVQVSGVTHIHAVAGMQVGSVTHSCCCRRAGRWCCTFMLLQACRSVVLHSRCCRSTGQWCYTHSCCCAAITSISRALFILKLKLSHHTVTLHVPPQSLKNTVQVFLPGPHCVEFLV
ncbi:uncharacterized protein LOC124902313 isoform X32 [Homo sapiens]|nr:uncharacterized protein LOC124902313 isoform X32 [Homo sapiens]|eukprot:XP_016870946.1 uncharacterized protein LOC101930307 isoform X29 [Homo sapiens]